MIEKILIKERISDSDLAFIKEESHKSVIVTSKDVEKLFKDRISHILSLTSSSIYYLDSFSLDDSMSLAKRIIEERIDSIIAFGGGTINDTCKFAAKVSGAKLISFPTIVSNDGVCSNVSVLKIDELRTDGFAAKSPDAIIIDLDIIKNSPQRFLKAGICDILSNYSSIWDWDLAISKGKEKPNDLARIMSSNAFWSLFNLPDNVEENLRIKLICESIVMSGLAMEIKGNTRPCSGSEHLFNHAMVANYPEIKVLHGYLVGLGSLVSSILQKQNFNKLVGFLKKNDIDVRPSSLGISKDVFIDAWKKAKETRPNRYTILNEVKLDDKLLTEIYEKIEKEAY